MKVLRDPFFIFGALLLPLAALVQFAFHGYTMTALCLVFLSACLFFFGLMRRWRTRTAKILTGAAVFCLLLGAALFLAAEIPVLKAAHSEEDTSAEYAIVFGAAVHGSVPSLSMIERCDAAAGWLKDHPEGIAVVSGGQGTHENMTEAQAMYDYLLSKGLDPSRILLEPEATSSYENLLFSLRLIEESGGDPKGRIALISSEYHLYRLQCMAEPFGCQPVCVAARTSLFTLRVNYFIREAFAVWKNRLLGAA